MFSGRAVTNASGNICPAGSEIRKLAGPGELFSGATGPARSAAVRPAHGFTAVQV